MARTATQTPVDLHVGLRIRGRRLQLGFSQEQLGDKIGVTFQQIQKYEKGKNRVGGDRLQAIAVALATPVSFFFEGAPGSAAPSELAENFIAELLADRRGLLLARAFIAISPAARDAVLAVADAFAATAPIAKRKAA